MISAFVTETQNMPYTYDFGNRKISLTSKLSWSQSRLFSENRLTDRPAFSIVFPDLRFKFFSRDRFSKMTLFQITKD